VTRGVLGGVDPLFVGYVTVFGLSALACFASIRRARRIGDPDTRRGLLALLVTTGTWATTHVAFLLAPTRDLEVAFYVLGLIVGLSSIGPWLYFCSAYTGRSLHRNATLRRVILTAYAVVVAVKLTNPLHQFYYTTEAVSTPFPHLAVQPEPLHWVVMGLSYALATVGYFMLFEMFTQVSYDTRPLTALAGLTALPVALDIVGFTSPLLVDITYEPIGVAAFGVGVLFVYIERFQTVQVAGEWEDPVIVLDEDDRVRDYNDSAGDLFSELRGRNAVGEPLSAVLPAVADSVAVDESLVELDRGETTRYYRVSTNPFGAGGSRIGTMLAVSDVTDREQYRRELERQNERLEQFASMVSHDLRNPLTVADGNIALARRERDGEHLETAAAALDRMETLIEDVLALARQGQPIDETEPVALSALAERCWGVVGTGEADLAVEADLEFMADPDRLQQLLENLFRNAVEHGGADVTVRVGALGDGAEPGFYVADDGAGIPAEDRETVFGSGYSTDEDGTGFGLAIVEEIAEAHGWEVVATESETGGARFEITGVTPA
jgi:signal transduction histidine kinase